MGVSNMDIIVAAFNSSDKCICLPLVPPPSFSLMTTMGLLIRTLMVLIQIVLAIAPCQETPTFLHIILSSRLQMSTRTMMKMLMIPDSNKTLSLTATKIVNF